MQWPAWQRTDHTAYFVAPIITMTDFIRNTKREFYDDSEKLEYVLEILDLEWSKDNDTKTQCN